jgi:SAM-dependent methyltransferase
MKVNVGCGITPTAGWINFDNSFSVRIARWPAAVRVLSGTRVMDAQSREMVTIANSLGVRFADATRRIPCADRSAEAVYSSHMIEHLDRREARAFLREVSRILRPGGVVRLAAPDLSRLASDYLATGDADRFVSGTHMVQPRPTGLVPRARAAVVGPRHHLWMYDGHSLSALLQEVGFADVSVLPPGKTHIADPGGLDLAERADESVYVEGIQPA